MGVDAGFLSGDECDLEIVEGAFGGFGGAFEVGVERGFDGAVDVGDADSRAGRGGNCEAACEGEGGECESCGEDERG